MYALGLIHANHGGNIIEYLMSQLKEAQNENVRHGGCLGLGLAAMGTHLQDVYEQLKFNLYQDDAVTGEAAGIAMGAVMLGSKNETAISDMVSVSFLLKFPLLNMNIFAVHMKHIIMWKTAMVGLYRFRPREAFSYNSTFLMVFFISFLLFPFSIRFVRVIPIFVAGCSRVFWNIV